MGEVMGVGAVWVISPPSPEFCCKPESAPKVQVWFGFFLLFCSLGLCGHAWAFSSCSGWGYALVAMLGLLIVGASLVSTGSRVHALQQFWGTGFIAEACGIFPDQASNPCPLYWQVDASPLDYQRSPHISFSCMDPSELLRR